VLHALALDDLAALHLPALGDEEFGDEVLERVARRTELKQRAPERVARSRRPRFPAEHRERFRIDLRRAHLEPD